MSYEAPKLTRYGKVSELTLGGTYANSDVPFGTAADANTAYPPIGS